MYQRKFPEDKTSAPKEAFPQKLKIKWSSSQIRRRLLKYIFLFLYKHKKLMLFREFISKK
jgi:hypothetical protein